MEKGIKIARTVKTKLSIELNSPSESCDLHRNLYLHPRGGKRTFNLRNAYFCKQPTSICNWLPQMCPILIWPWDEVKLLTFLHYNKPDFARIWTFKSCHWILTFSPFELNNIYCKLYALFSPEEWIYFLGLVLWVNNYQNILIVNI